MDYTGGDRWEGSLPHAGCRGFAAVRMLAAEACHYRGAVYHHLSLGGLPHVERSLPPRVPCNTLDVTVP